MTCVKPAIVSLLGLGLAGSLQAEPYPDLARLFGLPPTPRVDHLVVCFQYGCDQRVDTQLSESQWQQILTLFNPASPSPAVERARIAKAIGLIETWVGEKTGTHTDLGENPVAPMFYSIQLDCVDESVNSSTYVALLQNASLLRWHHLADRATRGIPPFSWPHNTAVIIDTGSGEAWAVDSWFEDNGLPPHIVPLSDWQAGWRP